MALPTYNKSKRRTTFETLPKDAYVVKILGAKEENGQYGPQVSIAFDIAEGKYAGFYQAQFERNTNEDKKWPFDAVFYLTVPEDSSPEYVWRDWNSFFADLEDSNNGFVFDGDVKKLKGKLIGGVFHIKQSAKGDKVYSNTKMKWSCVADDVRNGKITRFPDDVIVQKNAQTIDDFVNLPDGTDEKAPWE